MQATAQRQGAYLYCVADSGTSVSLGEIGLAGSEVCSVPYKDLCAVVHPCGADPYQPSDSEVLEAWVVAHQRVVDVAWERWGTVLPSRLGAVIPGEDGSDAGQNVRRWLETEYASLRQKIERVRGKAEYGVQVFWNPQAVARALTEMSPRARELQETIRSGSKGLAYLYRQELERLLKKEMEARADQCFKDWYSRVRKHVDDIRVEKTKKSESTTQMLMNLSCLISKRNYGKLAAELGDIDALPGVGVRFTGPWPPYSFVGAA